MLKATKIRIYPNTEQTDFLNQQFGAVRFAYNKSLAIINQAYKRHGVSMSAKKDMKPLLAVAKKSRKYKWLKQYDSIALQQACINLDRAFQNFFDPKLKARFPCFKKLHGKQSSYHCTSIKAESELIKIPKCSPIKARIHRDITGTLKSITLSRTKTGKYYASLLIDDGIAIPKPIAHVNSDQITGIDLGLTHLLIESNGKKEDNPRFLKRAYTNFRRKNKKLSRTKKGSKGRVKARIQFAQAHEKVANARSDFQHKLSRRLIDENQAVIVETLKSSNMMKNGKLAKHIADAAWHGLVLKLEYKAKEQGKHLVKIDQWVASSKTCSCCGHKLDSLNLDVREWDCPKCSSHWDRDINAAINVRTHGIIDLKAAGLSVSANGGLCKPGNLPVAA